MKEIFRGDFWLHIVFSCFHAMHPYRSLKLKEKKFTISDTSGVFLFVYFLFNSESFFTA